MTENGLNVWQIDVLHGSYTIPIATPALQAPRKILAFFLAFGRPEPDRFILKKKLPSNKFFLVSHVVNLPRQMEKKTQMANLRQMKCLI